MTLQDKLTWLANWKPCNFHIEYNPQATVYDSVEKWLDDNVDTYKYVDLLDGEREKMIATKTVWTLYVYPDTPVGHCSVAASTLEALIDWAMEQPPPRQHA